MISDASGETLTQLAAHLGFDATNERPGVQPSFWKTGSFRLFASHLAEHKDYATELQSHLANFNISAFVAHKDITPTREWQDEIELALSTADALVAILTPGFHDSSWTDQEVGFVMGRGLLAVAVRMGEEPYGFLGRLQAFQGEGKPTKALAREMCEAFMRNKQTRKSMTYAVLNLFEQSSSFDEAKRAMGVLEGTAYWEPQFEERIKRAVKENGQIVHSFGVPERAHALIRKWVPAKGGDAIEMEDIPFE